MFFPRFSPGIACGLIRGTSLVRAESVTAFLTPMLQVTITDTATCRGKDVANNACAAGFFGPDFSGYTDRMATVTCETAGGTFRGDWWFGA